MSHYHFKQGKKAEARFMELSGATSGTRHEDVNMHIDCWLDGESYDVKGYSKRYDRGYVLIEFINVAGNHGWCHPDSGAEYIVFEMEPNVFYSFKTQMLYKRAKGLVKSNNEHYNVIKANKVSAEDGLYKLIQREAYKGRERHDIFTYVRRDDIMDLLIKRYG